MKGMQVNRVDLARILGVPLPTLDSWISRGAPCVQQPHHHGKVTVRKRGYVFDTAAMINWCIENHHLWRDQGQE